MPRIRTIKPEFPQSESMGRVSRDARLLFILLWTIVDDSGKSRASSRMLASLLYPYDDDAKDLIDGWLSELEAENCLVRYEVEGKSYLQVLNWLNHQKIDHPSKSKIPDFRESSRILANPRETLALDRKGKEEERKGKEEAQGKPARPKFDPESVELPECVPSGLWAEWCRFRKESGKRLTETSVAQQLRDLQAWHSEGHDIAAIVKTSIASSWSGLFAPKTKGKVASKAAFDAFLDDKTIEGEWA